MLAQESRVAFGTKFVDAGLANEKAVEKVFY